MWAAVPRVPEVPQVPALPAAALGVLVGALLEKAWRQQLEPGQRVLLPQAVLRAPAKPAI